MVKKFSTLTILSIIMVLALATPAFATFYVGAYIGYDQYSGCSDPYDYVRGKSSAYSDHPDLDYVNVYGQFYSGGSLQESGVDSAGSGSEASVYTSTCTYSSSGSYYEYAAAREYYNDGTYSNQITDDSSW